MRIELLYKAISYRDNITKIFFKITEIRTMNKFSLRKKILILTILCFSVSFVALVIQNITALQKNIESSLEGEVNLLSEVITDSVGNWMLDRKNAVRELAKTISDHPEVKPYIFLEQVKKGLGFSITYFGTDKGVMNRNDPDPSLNPPGYDPRVRSWYKGAQQANGSFLTSPFVSATTKQTVVTLSDPVIVNNRFVGAVGANLTLEQLTKYINKLHVPGNGYAIVVDKSDQVIADPNANRQDKKASDINANFTGPSLANLVAKHSLQNMSLDNRDRLVFAQDIPHSNWSLILVMDKDTLYAPLHSQMIRQITISFIILVVVLLIMSFLLKIMFKNLSEITKSLDEIASGNGDLTIRLDVNSGDEIGQLATSFNRFVEQLHGIISRLRSTSIDLLSEAEGVSTVSTQQNDRLRRHQSEIHMVATAVTEMASATQEISSNAEQTALSAQQCVSISEKGRQEVEKSQNSTEGLAGEVGRASSIIGDLNQHVQSISSILSTISGISEQTNLLALNAAIEAARAGEQGRGFAVVADEVRVLSQRTHSSTQEIQGMIESLQTAAQNAVQATDKGKDLANKSVADAEEANQSLGQILESVHKINEMAAQIATAAEEQSAVTSEISNNTETIRGVGDEMSKASQLAAEQARKLHELGKQINQEVDNFRL
ncbi:methyl-accepting chemotaxis protein [Celerinatantimonas yamalensis]|uniref:Methyl-accepting chemotaxis protein n=1 Tax=Celerinatantimonas yamalensis TaxID=559956 RepID=A0ABW9G4L4_9GAMM